MQSATEFVETRRPAGGRRSGKRERIVEMFLRQPGHISADELVALIRREDARVSRATIYRTLQWMVDAGIARRVDFGEGRFRFEHAYRHPRHFHLICKTCNQSFEFLSSDIEAHDRGSRRRARVRAGGERDAGVRHVRGLPGRAEVVAAPDRRPTRVFARDALRIAIATERSGLDFYTRAAQLTRDARGRQVFQRLADEEKEHMAKLEARYRELLGRHAELEAQPTFLFFKGAANGLFAAGAEELKQGVDDRQALLIGIRCERGSHRFFKSYGERFEESEGKRIFLEFADEERDHLDLLVREYQALVARETKRRQARRRRRSGVIDLHLHTTASDGRSSPD